MRVETGRAGGRAEAGQLTPLLSPCSMQVLGTDSSAAAAAATAALTFCASKNVFSPSSCPQEQNLNACTLIPRVAESQKE